MGKATNNEAELHALDEGMSMCVEKGFSKILIKGDSQVVTNGVMQSSLCSWKLKTWLPMIEEKLYKSTEFWLAHTYHEGNRAVDWLGSEGIRIGTENILIDEMLVQNELSVILDQDRVGHPREGIGYKLWHPMHMW
ncbi:hypothetical protein SUGI_0220320 [Cryptomeria japonica]|nr:hypothetical protein SUGI_0220320 [Cryptomeria japonica]